MIEDGVYGVSTLENMFYLVEGNTIKVSVDGGEEYEDPTFETTIEEIKRGIDNGILFKVGEL